MDKIPSQINIQDMKDEVDVEITDSLEDLSSPEVEVTLEDDGGVVVDFDPNVGGPEGEFGDNLAEQLSDAELGRISGELTSEFEENKSGRQEWEDAFANGLELLGFSYEERAQPFRGASGVTHPLLS